MEEREGGWEPKLGLHVKLLPLLFFPCQVSLFQKEGTEKGNQAVLANISNQTKGSQRKQKRVKQKRVSSSRRRSVGLVTNLLSSTLKDLGSGVAEERKVSDDYLSSLGENLKREEGKLTRMIQGAPSFLLSLLHLFFNSNSNCPFLIPLPANTS